MGELLEYRWCMATGHGSVDSAWQSRTFTLIMRPGWSRLLAYVAGGGAVCPTNRPHSGPTVPRRSSFSYRGYRNTNRLRPTIWRATRSRRWHAGTPICLARSQSDSGEDRPGSGRSMVPSLMTTPTDGGRASTQASTASENEYFLGWRIDAATGAGFGPEARITELRDSHVGHAVVVPTSGGLTPLPNKVIIRASEQSQMSARSRDGRPRGRGAPSAQASLPRLHRRTVSSTFGGKTTAAREGRTRPGLHGQQAPRRSLTMRPPTKVPVRQGS
jgi:hypothetical protein